MITVKRLTENDVAKIIAAHFDVTEDKVEFDPDNWEYEDWICEVRLE